MRHLTIACLAVFGFLMCGLSLIVYSGGEAIRVSINLEFLAQFTAASGVTMLVALAYMLVEVKHHE